jgi:preprotein translocase subunit SecG
MDTIETILLILLIADAIGLTVLVLMQQGKGAEVGAAFGSGAANTIFGSAGANSFLTRLTVWLAIGFFLITFGLAYTAKQRAGNVVIEGLPEIPEETAPADVPLGGDKPSSGLTEDTESVDSGVPEV